jgi:type VI secretion system protein VasJ
MELIEIGKLPIADNAPAGEDIRSDAIFSDLSAEIEKMSSPFSMSSADWKMVLNLSSDIIQNRSKDLLVLSYLCVALEKTRGLKGLAIGVHIYRDMLSTYWESMFPSKKRMHGRRNAIEWLVEKITTDIEGMQTEEWPKDSIESFLDDLNGVNTFLRENMDEAPAMDSLIAAIVPLIREEGSRSEKTIQEPVDEPATKENPAAKTLNTSNNVHIIKINPDEGPQQMLNQGINMLRVISSALMQQNKLNAVAFRLNRIIAWASVEQVPPDGEGKSLIPPPDEQVINYLKDLCESGKWKDLLDASETRIPQFPFWLDLSHYVVESLKHLGEKALSEEIEGETAIYVKRLHGIERLSFSDGTPFADQETRDWIKDLYKKTENRAPTVIQNTILQQQIDQELARARSIAREGNLSAALQNFKNKITGASSERDRFLWQISLCDFLSQSKYIQFAVPYFQELIRCIDVYRIAEWEPALAVEAFVVVLSGLSVYGGEGNTILVRDVLNRLILLDPSKAMNFVS